MLSHSLKEERDAKVNRILIEVICSFCLCVSLNLNCLGASTEGLKQKDVIATLTSRGQDIPDDPRILWDMSFLEGTPEVYPAPDFEAKDVKPLFYKGLPWKEKSTRIFAWIGIPKVKTHEKVPGIVLAHGGFGTAFPEWVKLWVDRGHAAIAMDLGGTIPSFENDEWRGRAHKYGGPPGWWDAFGQIDEPFEDQWNYHAVANIVLAHSLLRSFPEVDNEHIGIAGISWGGYLTCIVSGLDQRFKYASTVYGCGYWDLMPGADKIFVKEEQRTKWFKLWDASLYLKHTKMPMLWVRGADDPHYPLDSFQKSYQLPKGKQFFSVRTHMPHNHPDGMIPKEVFVFADNIVKGSESLVEIIGHRRNDDNISVEFKTQREIVKAEVNCTGDAGQWNKWNWETVEANIDKDKNIVSGILSEGTKVYFINMIDNHGLIASSEIYTVN